VNLNVKKRLRKKKFDDLNEICIQQGKELRGLILLLLACNEMLGRAKSGPYTESDLEELADLEKHMKQVFDLFIEPNLVKSDDPETNLIPDAPIMTDEAPNE
jgi:hypothetical protein